MEIITKKNLNINQYIYKNYTSLFYDDKKNYDKNLIPSEDYYITYVNKYTAYFDYTSKIHITELLSKITSIKQHIFMTFLTECMYKVILNIF